MSFLEKNMAGLKEYDAVLYQKVCERIQNPSLENKFLLNNARNGELSLVYIEGNSKKNILSSYNPSQEGERWAEAQPLAESYIIYGLGLAYHLPHIVCKDSVNRILVIEPELDLFILTLNAVDLEWLWKCKTIQISVGRTNDRINKYYCFDRGVFLNFQIVGLPGYVTLFEDDFLKIKKEYSEQLGTLIVDVGTVKKQGNIWTQNFFANLYVTLKSSYVNGLFDKFVDIPVVLVAAGPSLNKNVHLLQELNGRAVIICVATAYKLLTRHGIIPDFIVSYEGDKKNYELFQHGNIRNIPFIFDPVIYPDILKIYDGPLIAANVTKKFLGWFEKKLDVQFGDVLVGPSIANVGFDIARKIGGNPIIFVGQDLAFLDGRTHANDTIWAEQVYTAQKSIYEVYVEDIYGGKVLTGRNFLSFLRWFEKEIQMSPGRTFIDATEGGAKIAGTKIMTLREVIDQYCQNKYPIQETIVQFLKTNDTPSVDFFRAVVTLLDEIKAEMEHFKAWSEEILTSINEMKRLYTKPMLKTKNILNLIAKVNRTDAQIQNLSAVNAFLHFLFLQTVLPIMNGPDAKAKDGETELEERERILRYQTNLYTMYKELAKLLLDAIESSRQEIIEKEGLVLD